jgi:hypothetical protein
MGESEEGWGSRLCLEKDHITDKSPDIAWRNSPDNSVHGMPGRVAVASDDVYFLVFTLLVFYF